MELGAMRTTGPIEMSGYCVDGETRGRHTVAAVQMGNLIYEIAAKEKVVVEPEDVGRSGDSGTGIVPEGVEEEIVDAFADEIGDVAHGN
jgi:hypothetical protein